MQKMASIDFIVAEVLRRRRLLLGLSPAAMKALAGVEPRDLRRYEAAICSVPNERLLLICEALALTPGDLLALAQNGNPALGADVQRHHGLDDPA